MTKGIKVSILIFILVHASIYGQRIGFDLIDDSKVSQWKSGTASDYQNVYHFGDSEMESDLILLFINNKYYAQIKSGEWSQDETIWKIKYENLSNVRIEGNKFYSDKTNGEFVFYDNGDEKIKGLKVYNSWSGLTEKGEYEIGTKSYPVDNYYNGKYKQASTRKLCREDLTGISKPELKIMRNEIYARYGFRFKAGGEMDIYFKNQEWYSGLYENIDEFLTEIEKENISLIQQIEKE